MLRCLIVQTLGLLAIFPALGVADDTYEGKTRKEWLKVLADDPSARQREKAVLVLTGMPMRDQASEDAIRDALGDKSERVRIRALKSIAVIILTSPKNQSGTLEVIGKVLVNDASDDVRSQALDIVKEVRQEDHQKKLLSFVTEVMRSDKLPLQRAGAAAVLGRMGPIAKTSINIMVECLKDPEPAVRAAIAEALGRIGDEAKGSIPKLVLLLKDPDPAPRLAAAFALGRIGPEAAVAVPDLAQALGSDTDANVRKEAARACSLLGLDAKGAIPALAKALKEDKSEEVRQQAALALGKMRGDEVLVAIPAMVEAMKKDADKSVRIFVVHALGNCLGDGLRAYVKDMADQLLVDKDGDVRLAFVQELGGLGPAAKDALPALNRMVTDVQLSVRDEAKKAVKKVMEKQ